jgi:hypothetical protein
MVEAPGQARAYCCFYSKSEEGKAFVHANCVFVH